MDGWIDGQLSGLVTKKECGRQDEDPNSGLADTEGDVKEAAFIALKLKTKQNLKVTKSKSKLETGRLRTKRVETRKLDIARTLKNHRETYSTRDNTTTSRGKHRA